MLIRQERPADLDAVRQVVAAAFAGGPDAEPVESHLLSRLRDDPGWIPDLSLVATNSDGSVVGHVVATRGHVDGHPALGLGPIAVQPESQGCGVGSGLMHAALAVAESRDETLIALLGDPAFYRRFGFRAAAEVAIAAPDPSWGTFFQVRVLRSPAPTGTFHYATPFSEP